MLKSRKYNKLTMKKVGVKVLATKRPVVTVEVKGTPDNSSYENGTSKSRELLKNFGNRYRGFNLVGFSRRFQ